jgi:hypothetical protein
VELPLYKSCFDNTGSPELVCETFIDLSDPTRGEIIHDIFMEKVTDDTNQGTPLQRDSCAFPLFGNIGVILMATLYIPGLNVGLSVWLGTIPNIPSALYTSPLSTLCHGNHVDVPLSTKSSPPPSTFFGESIDTSNRKSKRNRKRKNMKKKSPTSMSHVRDRSPTSASHVGDSSATSSSHVEDRCQDSTSHVGGKSPVTASHTGDRSVASVSHVIDPSPTYAIHVGDVKPTTASHVGGIDFVEKHRRIGCKPKFPCKICKGDHLTHLCLGLLEVRRLWSLSASSYVFESSEVSSQYIHPFVDEVVTLMQSLVDPTPIMGGDVSIDHVFS